MASDEQEDAVSIAEGTRPLMIVEDAKPVEVEPAKPKNTYELPNGIKVEDY